MVNKANIAQDKEKAKKERERISEESRFATQVANEQNLCKASLNAVPCIKYLTNYIDSRPEVATFFARQACLKGSQAGCQLALEIRQRLSDEINSRRQAEQLTEQTKLNNEIRQLGQEQREAEQRRANSDAIRAAGNAISDSFIRAGEAYKPKKSMTCRKDYMGGTKCTED